MSRRPSRPKRPDPNITSFFRSVYDSLARKVLEEEAGDAPPVEARPARKADERPAHRPAARAPKERDSNEKTIH